MNSSFVVVDIEKKAYSFTRKIFEKNGYKVALLDLSLSDKSESYNPLYYCKTITDVEDLISCFGLYGHEYKELFGAIISFLTVNAPQKDVPYAQLPEIVGDEFYFRNPTLKTFFSLVEMVCSRKASVYLLLVDMFGKIRKYEEKINESSYCLENWDKYCDYPNIVKEILHSDLMYENGLVKLFKESGLDKITQENTIQIERLGVEKTAVFVNIEYSFKAKEMSYLVRMFFNQVYSKLMRFEDLLMDSKKMVLPNGELVKWFSADGINSCKALEEDIRGRNIGIMADNGAYQILRGNGEEIAKVATYLKAERYVRALRRYKIESCLDGTLPMHVSIILSEQGIIGEIPLMTTSMAISSPLNISTAILSQSISEFRCVNKCPDTLLASFGQWICMGYLDEETYALIDKKIELMRNCISDKNTDEEKESYRAFDISNDKEIVVFVGEEKYMKDKKYNLKEHPNYKYL